MRPYRHGRPGRQRIRGPARVRWGCRASGDTMQLVPGGDLAASVANFNNIVKERGRTYTRRWIVTAGVGGTRSVDGSGRSSGYGATHAPEQGVPYSDHDVGGRVMQRQGRAGFTLIEPMISLTLLAIVVGGLPRPWSVCARLYPAAGDARGRTPCATPTDDLPPFSAMRAPIRGT